MRKTLPTYVRNDIYTGPTLLRWINAIQYGSSLSRSLKLNLLNGSREHFYHFLIGYMLPLICAQERLRYSQFQVLDCGPLMNPILKETLERLGFNATIVPPEHVSRPIYVVKWDQDWKLPQDAELVERTVSRVKEAWKDFNCPDCNAIQSENLILRRSEPHAFYQDGSSEKPGYGTSRRGITNLTELTDYLTDNGVRFTIYEPGVHCLGCQIRMFASAKKILGFRGAEWANLIWAPQEVRIRMLDSSPPATSIGRFMNRLQIQHEFAIVPQDHSPENPDEALRFFQLT